MAALSHLRREEKLGLGIAVVAHIALVAALHHGGKPPLVTLRADRSLEWARVAAVMGELNHAGFNSISLVTNGSGEAP